MTDVQGAVQVVGGNRLRVTTQTRQRQRARHIEEASHQVGTVIGVPGLLEAEGERKPGGEKPGQDVVANIGPGIGGVLLVDKPAQRPFELLRRAIGRGNGEGGRLHGHTTDALCQGANAGTVAQVYRDVGVGAACPPLDDAGDEVGFVEEEDVASHGSSIPQSGGCASGSLRSA